MVSKFRSEKEEFEFGRKFYRAHVAIKVRREKMKVLLDIAVYIADRVFSGIVMGVVLAVVLMELARRGYLNIGG